MAASNDVNSVEYWEDKKRRANAVFNRPSSDAEQRQANQVIRNADQQIPPAQADDTAARRSAQDLICGASVDSLARPEFVLVSRRRSVHSQ